MNHSGSILSHNDNAPKRVFEYFMTHANEFTDAKLLSDACRTTCISTQISKVKAQMMRLMPDLEIRRKLKIVRRPVGLPMHMNYYGIFLKSTPHGQEDRSER